MGLSVTLGKTGYSDVRPELKFSNIGVRELERDI